MIPWSKNCTGVRLGVSEYKRNKRGLYLIRLGRRERMVKGEKDEPINGGRIN